MLHAMFMCLGLDLVCHAMCYCIPFVHFIVFSYVLAQWLGPDLDPMIFVIVHTSRPTSKGLDHPICMSILACFYASMLLCFMLVLASLVLGFAMLDTFHGLDLVWLHLTPMRPCLDVTIWEASPDAGLLRTYPSLSAPCDAMLTMLVCATCWLSMHLYTLAYMFMHESCLLVCRPCFNTMKLWTFDPNLHLSPHRHHLLFALFIVCLFAYFLVCLPSSSLAFLVTCHVSYHMLCLLCLYACLLYTHCTLSTHLFLSIACLLVPCLCLCMYTHGARTQGVKAWSNRHKKKGHGCKHVDMSQVAMFSRFRDLASPIWLCTLLNPLPSSLLSLLDGLY